MLGLGGALPSSRKLLTLHEQLVRKKLSKPLCQSMNWIAQHCFSGRHISWSVFSSIRWPADLKLHVEFRFWVIVGFSLSSSRLFRKWAVLGKFILGHFIIDLKIPYVVEFSPETAHYSVCWRYRQVSSWKWFQEGLLSGRALGDAISIEQWCRLTTAVGCSFIQTSIHWQIPLTGIKWEGKLLEKMKQSRLDLN